MSEFRFSNAVISNKPVYLKDAEKFEDELAETADNAEAPSDDADTTTVKSDADTTDWKKRYSDLQSHVDKKLNAITAALEAEKQKRAEAEQRAKEAENKPKSYPATAAQLQEWAESFPDFEKILTTYIEMKTDSMAEKLRTEMKSHEEALKAMAAEKGRAKLLELHPDAFEIEKDPQFAAWLEVQKPRVKALIESADPYEIAEGLTLYKARNGIKTKQKTDSIKDASSAVLPASPAATPKEKKIWKESEVDKMHPRTFAKYEAEIDKARAEGRFEYDLSAI